MYIVQNSDPYIYTHTIKAKCIIFNGHEYLNDCTKYFFQINMVYDKLIRWIVHCSYMYVCNKKWRRKGGHVGDWHHKQECESNGSTKLIKASVITVRAPVFGRHQFFGTSEHYGKAHGSLLSGWMNYNYTAHVAGFLHPAIFEYFHHSSDKSGLKVTDCTVQSAEYWCSYGTFEEKKKEMGKIVSTTSTLEGS